MILTLLVIAIIIFFIYGYVSNFRFVETKYIIRDKKLCNIVNDKPIVILSDLHNCTFGNNNEKLKSRIDAISPAYIFIVGDMVNNSSDNNNFYARDIVNYLASKYPVIYSDGNHEQGFFDDYFGNFCENKYIFTKTDIESFFEKT